MAEARTPLMAGNWKMNLNHVEAVHLVQKLAWTLQDKKHDFERVEVAVLPPFTDIRGVQTLVDGDRLKIVYGAQDLSPHDEGAYTGDISAGPPAPRRGRLTGQPQGLEGAYLRAGADRMHR
jgi:triosephosphate isomerase